MLARLFLGAILLLAGKADKAGDPALVGSWGIEGHTFMVLKADGTGTMEEDALTWKADGQTLIVTSAQGETDKAAYKVSGAQLAIVVGGTPMTLVKIGAAKPETRISTRASSVDSKIDVNQSLSKTLLSSTYARYSGTVSPP